MLVVLWLCDQVDVVVEIGYENDKEYDPEELLTLMDSLTATEYVVDVYVVNWAEEVPPRAVRIYNVKLVVSPPDAVVLAAEDPLVPAPPVIFCMYRNWLKLTGVGRTPIPTTKVPPLLFPASVPVCVLFISKFWKNDCVAPAPAVGPLTMMVDPL